MNMYNKSMSVQKITIFVTWCFTMMWQIPSKCLQTRSSQFDIGSFVTQCSSTHHDTGGLNSYIHIYNLFCNERLIMYKSSFFHNLVQSASRLVLNSSRSKRKYLERCLKLSFFSWMSFIGFLRNVIGELSNVSDVPPPKLRNAHLEHVQKPNRRS